MALMMGAVYAAFKEAGASEASAAKAAEELTGYTEAFSKLEARITAVSTDLKKDVQELRGEFNVMRWMVGFNLAMTVAVLFLLFRIMPSA